MIWQISVLYKLTLKQQILLQILLKQEQKQQHQLICRKWGVTLITFSAFRAIQFKPPIYPNKLLIHTGLALPCSWFLIFSLASKSLAMSAAVDRMKRRKKKEDCYSICSVSKQRGFDPCSKVRQILGMPVIQI